MRYPQRDDMPLMIHEGEGDDENGKTDASADASLDLSRRGCGGGRLYRSPSEETAASLKPPSPIEVAAINLTSPRGSMEAAVAVPVVGRPLPPPPPISSPLAAYQTHIPMSSAACGMPPLMAAVQSHINSGAGTEATFSEVTASLTKPLMTALPNVSRDGNNGFQTSAGILTASTQLPALALTGASPGNQAGLKNEQLQIKDRFHHQPQAACEKHYERYSAPRQLQTSPFPPFSQFNGCAGGNSNWQGKCPHCSEDYTNISSLKYHVRLVHSEVNNTICCYLCPENFPSKPIMRDHLFHCHNVKYQ